MKDFASCNLNRLHKKLNHLTRSTLLDEFLQTSCEMSFEEKKSRYFVNKNLKRKFLSEKIIKKVLLRSLARH